MLDYRVSSCGFFFEVENYWRDYSFFVRLLRPYDSRTERGLFSFLAGLSQRCFSIIDMGWVLRVFFTLYRLQIKNQNDNFALSLSLFPIFRW